MKFFELIAHPLYALRKIEFVDKLFTYLAKRSLTYVYSIIISIILFIFLRDII